MYVYYFCLLYATAYSLLEHLSLHRSCLTAPFDFLLISSASWHLEYMSEFPHPIPYPASTYLSTYLLAYHRHTLLVVAGPSPSPRRRSPSPSPRRRSDEFILDILGEQTELVEQ